MEVAQAVDERLDVIEREEVQWPRTTDRGEDRPSDRVEIGAAHRAEGGILAISELGHLLPQFRNRRGEVPCCPLATRDQIERHPKLRLELVAVRTLPVGIAVMLTRSARLALDRHIAHSTERSDGAAREHARHPFRRGAIHHDDLLGVHVVGIARRDTHHRLIHGLPVSRSLHLSGIEAKRVEEGEVRRWRIERRQDHRMM